jgi:amino acid adenylation domain-containing protein
MQINATQLNYWQQHLENAPAVLSLPTDKQRQGMANPQTAVLNTQLPTQLAPSATHLLAAYGLLLLHHSQQDDGVVGTAVAHQLLPLRVTISPHTTFAQLLEQLNEAYQQAEVNALPLAELINGLASSPGNRDTPLFQAVFAEGCLPESSDAALYDLTLVATREADGWQCAWHYRADLFTQAHLQQFATDLQTLLHAVTNNAAARLTTLLASSVPVITATKDPKKHALSPAQQRLWFFYKVDPQSPAYTEPIAIHLRGPVNVAWLQQSLTDMATRHEVLRTVYVEEGEELYGRVLPLNNLPLPILDLRHLPATEQETAVTHHVAEEDERPFDLAREIPIRTRLLHLSGDHWVLLLTLHHIAMDLWSIELIIEEITALYRAYQAGHTPDLPPLPIQYSDYATWQKSWLAEHEADQLAYWKQTLSPDPEPLDLLTDKPRDAITSNEGANYAFPLPDPVVAQVMQFMQKERVTLFMLLLAAYHALMHRYTEQKEINVGVPFANRHQDHTEKLIGFFTNTIVINATIQRGTTFRQLLGQVWERVLGAQDHQDLPFNKVVEAVQTTRRDNISPLFQTFFTVQAIEGRPQIPGVAIEPVAFESKKAKFDLMLSIAKQGKQINGFVEYRTALFTPERIHLLGDHYVNLLTTLMQQPDTPIGEIDFRTEEERMQHSKAANIGVSPQPLMAQFADVAAQYARKTAVASPQSTFTYDQLHQFSNQIAHLLLNQHIQPGDVVAVLGAPTPQTIAAVLGILKMGAVYLPLNEDDPLPWQQATLKQAQARLLLYSTQAKPASEFTHLAQLAIETAQNQPTDDPQPPTAGGIYLPMFGHFPAAELARLAELYPTEPASQVVQFAPFASHQAAHELFATLLNGGTLHLATRDQVTKLAAIYELLNNRRINFAILPTALIAAMDPQKAPHLETLVSLEADMDPTHWQKWAGRQRWHGHLSGASLLPTMLSAVEAAGPWLSGTAVSATTLLDAQYQPTPAGVLGTLHLGPNQLPTGDQFCWLPDGRLQFRHYHPTHTTTRGRYLATEAIAAVLRQHPAVHQCIVLPNPNPAEKRQLNAYLIPTPAWDEAQVKQFAQAQLPAPFVPAQFQTITRLPLTAAGEVDYQALQTMQQQENQQDQQADSRAAKRSELAERRKNLSAKQQALLDKWQQKKQDENNQPLIPRLAADQKRPLSFAQRRLLMLDHLDPNKATYNVPLALQIDGRLNETILQQALDALYVRHSSLRTTFFYGDDEHPYQHVAETTHLPINRVDFSTTEATEREAAAQAWILAEVQRPFSLTTGPLIRVAHLRLAETQHLLVIVMHHIITDGWSMNIFVQEFLQLYAAQVQGSAANLASHLPDLPIDYSDFAAWQQEWLQGETLALQVAYWKEQLSGAPAVITLPIDLPRPKMQSTRGRTYIQMLPAAFTPALADLSQANSSTLFMTLFTAYNVLLARYSQQDDLVVGTPIANRNQRGIENLIGFFVNMLPLRTRLSGEDTFTTLLARVRQTALDAYNHQDIPFEQVVNSLQPDRDTSYTPVFQVAFALRNNENMELPALNGLKLTPLTTDNRTAKYDLTLIITETNAGLRCTWEYCTDLFLEDTIQRMHTHFETLLQSIVQEPSRPVKRLDILPQAEKQLLLHSWQGAADNTIPQICLHQQFEMWAEQQPRVTAVADPTLTLTYQQLNQRANQLARLLINQGVRPGDAVGIHMTASTPAIVIIMACHKARAAYVPFDPTYPTQRLQLMLDDTAAPVVLTDSSLDHLDTGRCAVWHWAAIQPALAEQPDTNLNLDYTPTDPAYIIYTSGSTGKPKGVVCGHTGVFNLQRAFNDWGLLPPQAIFSLWTSLNFDASVYEIFPAYITGGSLIIVPQEIRSDALALFAWLAENQIQHSYLPPFMVEPFYKWLQEQPNGSAMRRLMVGVEPLSEQTLVGIQKLVPGLTIINAYGPTEATVISTAYRVPRDSSRQGNAPIGRALPNFQVYVLDEFMQPVPIGVAGELYVGGIGLAHGYLNRPELTDERFVPNPFDKVTRRQGDKETNHPVTLSPGHLAMSSSHTPSPLPPVTLSRLYKTGDLVRYLADGNIMFIGRTDFQLKVRGFRVELGEIEANLLAQPGVETAVVMPYTAADGQTALVAYFTVEAGADPAPNQQTLHSALSQTLPNYMVPAIWVPLAAMPRTPNDKIDRKALPVPGLEEIERTLPFVAPRTEVEQQLHTLWQTLLNLPEISIHDSFFQLGGHSLLATQLVSRVQKQFNVKLQLRDVFEHSTIAQIAQLVETAQTAVPATNQNSTPARRQQPIPQYSGDQPPLSFAQRRLLVIDQLDPNQATYNIPLAFAVNGRLDEAALQTAADQLAARHPSLRTTFPTADSGEPYQHISATTHLPVTHIDFTAQPADVRQAETRAWLEMEAQRPFNLSTGPLVRLSHLRLSDTEHVLVIVMHHIITDGWSMNIFVREFISLYIAQVQAAAANLPEMRVHYADFAAWQQGWLQGDELKQQLTYWQNHLADAPAVLSLPTDLPRPKLQGTNGRTLTHQLSPELSAALLQLSQAHNSTLFMTLFAAYNVLLARVSQQEDIVVGTPIANRNHTEIENIIGFFVNMLPLRTQVNGQASFTDLLAQVRQTALEAYNHQDIPFEQVVNLLQPVRDTSHSPIFQVSFALANAPAPLPQLPNLRFTPLTAESQTSKYDLTLAITETNNGLICTWEFSTDLFFVETIERLHGRFATLLHSIVAAPEQTVARLPLLPAAEQQLLLHDWQGQPDTQLPQLGLHQQFEQWVSRQPEATAVADPTQTLTYQQLNQRANQLARLLIQHGVLPGNALWASTCPPACPPSWPFWPATRPGPPMCPSTPPIPPSACNTCWTIRPLPSFSPIPAWTTWTQAAVPFGPGMRCKPGWTNSQGKTLTCPLPHRSRLHHLHLWLDRPA